MFRKRLTMGTLLAFFLIANTEAYAAPVESFKSNGKTIRLEWFPSLSSLNPKDKEPLLLILHGSGGIEASGGFFRSLATELSRRGHNAVIIHYFDQTGTKFATNADMSKYFAVWLRTVNSAIEYCNQLSFVDSTKVSILGHSLGAQLALQTAAAEKNRTVCSVIDMSGCFVYPTKNITAMPPVLILHGQADTVVPMSREKTLLTTLKKIGSPVEEHLFPGADHAFNHVSFEQLIDLSDKFLTRY